MFTLIDSISRSVFGNSDAANGTGFNFMYGIAEAFCTWQGGSDTDVPAYSVTREVYVMLAPVAMTLALCFCVVALLDQIQRYGMDNITFTVILTPLLRFAVCMFILQYGLNIVGLTMGYSNQLIRTMGDVGGETITGDFMNTFTDGLNGWSGMLARILMELLVALLSLFAQIVAGVALAYQIITIRIEFLVRLAFMPLALPSIAQDGVHGSGMRYLKRLLFDMFMLSGILVTVKLTFFVLMSVSLDFGDMGLAWNEAVLSIVKSLFVTVAGPFMCLGAVSSFKAALAEVAG